MGIKRSAKTNSLEPAKKKAKAAHATQTVTKSPKSSAVKARKSGAAPARAEAEKVYQKASGKRRRPVTVPVNESGSDLEDGDQGDEDEVEYEGAGDDVLMGEGEPNGDEDEAMGGPGATKDPNAARELHKAQKALLVQRRASKLHSSLLIWPRPYGRKRVRRSALGRASESPTSTHGCDMRSCRRGRHEARRESDHADGGQVGWTKGEIAGDIISAIATMNAIIFGLIVLRFPHLLRKP